MVKPISLKTPFSAGDVLALRVGDIVSISGVIVTGRDRIHKYIVEQKPGREEIPFDLAGSIIYHCGPVVRETGEGYRILSAGPTTSMRVEMYQAAVVREYGLRGIMGKGGMGPDTLRALKDCGCVYCHTIGGAAVCLADRITRTIGAWKLDEFGTAEAMWCLEVEDFPAIVTMDTLGNDVHREVEKMSMEKSALMLQKKGGEAETG